MNTKKIIHSSTCGLACFHIICCGLPTIAAIFGVAAPFSVLFPPLIMNVLMGIGGLMLLVSWGINLRGCACSKGCICKQKNRKILIFSTILFAIAVLLRFGLPMITGVESCH